MSRKKFSFNIMLAGAAGIGKSSFINTLFKKNMVEVNKKVDNGEIDVYLIDVDCEGVKNKVSIIDTPGFGSFISDESIHRAIVSYIKTQFDLFLAEETKIKRNIKYEDSRVHVMLYFITPRTSGMKKSDIEFLKRVSTLVNILPIIGKSDILTTKELKQAKNKIQRQIIENSIPIYDFTSEPSPSGIELNNIIPFSILSNYWCDSEQRHSGRQYNWGTATPENTHYCDFSILKEVLFTSYTEPLIDFTSNGLYENYRSDVLSSIVPPSNR